MNILRNLVYRYRNAVSRFSPPADPALKITKKLSERHFTQEKPLKVLFLANGMIPNLEISFLHPLADLIECGRIQECTLTEVDLKEYAKSSVNKQAKMNERLDQLWAEFEPDLVVSCRYSGPLSAEVISKCNQQNIPFILYLDDDLLNVPKQLGPQKYAYHNHPHRTGAIRLSMEQADVIYSSTEELSRKLESYNCNTPIVTAQIFCAGQQFEKTVATDPRVFGYMGFGHGHDLEVALEGIVSLLSRRADLSFELFGTIPKPEVLNQFGSRVTVRPPVRSSYADFLQTMNELNWAVGITPLADLEFNRFKANTKWVEYSSVGIAVVSNDHVAYRDAILPDNGRLVSQAEDWGVVIEKLLDDTELRQSVVANAQQKLKTNFNQKQLQDQVLELFQRVGINLDVSEHSRQAA